MDRLNVTRNASIGSVTFNVSCDFYIPRACDKPPAVSKNEGVICVCCHNVASVILSAVSVALPDLKCELLRLTVSIDWARIEVSQDCVVRLAV